MNNNNNNMLHCLNTSGNLTGDCSDMTVLERQRPRMKWQQEQQQQQPQNQGFHCGTGFHAAVSSLQVHNSQEMMMTGGGDSALAEMLAQSMKSDPGLENGWPELGKYEMPSMGFGSSGFDVNSVISRTSNCPNAVAATAVADAKVRVSASGKEKMSSATGKESFKKRKADKVQNSKVVVAENDNQDKRIKVRAEEGESKATEQNSTKNTTATTNNNNGETSAGTSKENSKVSEVQKPDYIHVRARRGQATDSHSLAERVRREKISERMKYLQDLVPGCNKITGKAGMLDEIINYVQSLQRQVEFLSMKLATVNPRLDFNVDDLFTKEMFAAFAPSFPTSGMPPDMNNPGYLQFNCGIDMGINPPDMGLRKSISAPVSMPETFLDSCCFNQILPSCTWESDLHNLSNVAFDEARITPFASQPFTGVVEGSNLKMEM